MNPNDPPIHHPNQIWQVGGKHGELLDTDRSMERARIRPASFHGDLYS